MWKAETQYPRGTHIQSNDPLASTGMALAYLSLKKNTGGPRFEREGEKEAALVKKKEYPALGRSKLSNQKTHKTIKLSPGIYWHGSCGFDH